MMFSVSSGGDARTRTSFAELRSFAATPAWEAFTCAAFLSLVNDSRSRRPKAVREEGLFAVASGEGTVACACGRWLVYDAM